MRLKVFLSKISENKNYLKELEEVTLNLSIKDIEGIFQKLIEFDERLKIERYNIYIDGATKGNPGPSAVGIIVKDVDGEVVERMSEYIGDGTNNRAEYIACVKALKLAKDIGLYSLVIYSDSELVVKQLNGEYRVKDKNLYEYYKEIRKLEKDFDSVEYKHIPRENNKEADGLANTVLKDKNTKKKGDKDVS